MNAPELAASCLSYARSGLDEDIERDPSIEGLALVKLSLDRCRRALSEAEAQLVDVMADAVPPDGEWIEGVGKVEIKHSPKSAKWDSDALIALIRAQAQDERRVDEATGEYEDPVSAFERAIRECSSIENPSHSWRVTAIKKRLPHDRDLDEYRTVDGWRTSVVITGAKEEAA